KRKVAAVIIEPMGGESGANPVRPGFNKEVEELCHENGTLLISDEVVCAFRLHMGGGQAYYGYTPDLSVFGKIVGHGYPSAAAIGGKEEIMRFCAAGVGGGKRAYSGGTLAANPLTCAAAYNAMKLVEETGATEKAGKAGARLANGLNEVFAKYELPWFSYNLGGTVHFHTSCLFGLSFDISEQVGQLPLRKKFIELNNAYTELTNQEPPTIADLFKAIFGNDWFGWSVNQDDFFDKAEFSKTSSNTEEYLEKLWNSEEYKLYNWAENKMKLLNGLNFKCYNTLCYFKHEDWKPEVRPMVLEGIKDIIKHFQRVLNNEVDIKEKIPKFVNPIKDKNLTTYWSYNTYQKLLFDLRNQYHPKFINKFPEKYQSFIYEKIREMIIRLEKDFMAL
ncbi:unnamed protein product, partial [marine sediment metagenome]